MKFSGYHRGRKGGNSNAAKLAPPLSIDTFFTDAAWACIAHDLRLSGRETDILKRILKDQKEPAIAIGLGLSPHTVHSHLDRVYGKLEVRSRVQVVLRLFESFIRTTMDPKVELPSICSKRATGRCPLVSPN